MPDRDELDDMEDNGPLSPGHFAILAGCVVLWVIGVGLILWRLW